MAQDLSNPLIPLDTKQETGLLTYCRQAHSLLISQLSLRSAMEEIDRSYMREKNYTKEQWEAKLANLRGDVTKMQDVTVPIVMPQVESALSYMANVFCSGYPIFGVESDPTNADAALMMETIIGENSVTASWSRQMLMFFRDGLKYNLHALECAWTQRNTYSIETDASRANSAKVKTTIWNGNSLKRMDLYNTFFDPRVHPSEIHEKGEFAGYIELKSRVGLRQYISQMVFAPRDDTVKRALSSASVTSSWSSGSPFSFYMPLINPFPMMNPQAAGMYDWMAWVQNVNEPSGETRYAGMYELMTIYCRIVPIDFGLSVPGGTTPQVWKLIIVNGQVILSAERLSNAHGWIPIFFGQPFEDGLDFQTKSYAQNVGDMQSSASTMMNGYIASKRRLVTDRVLFNPMAVSKKDISSKDPAAKIPIKPAWYGKELGTAVYQFPYRDEGADSLLSGISVVSSWSDKINGQNPAQQGQFVKGNKTQSEYDDVMGHGNGRNQLMAMMTESQVFVPMKECIKLNILQYQKDGVIYSSKAKQPVQVDITALRTSAVQFKISDGILPTDKLMDADSWTVAIQTIGSSPQIGGAFNIGPMFSYMMKEKGVDLTPFTKSKAQQVYEQQMQAWQQMGEAAMKAGQPFNQPMPQPSPQLQQEMQAAQQNGGIVPGTSQIANALSSTVPQGQQTPTPPANQPPQVQPQGGQGGSPQPQQGGR